MIITKLNASFLYNTNSDSKTNFDCFYAHIIDDISKTDGSFFRINHLTPYCRHLLSNDSIDEAQGHVENIVTFENLHSQKIRSEHLFQWSVSIDVIEQYAMYLITNDTKFDKTKFYNCSLSWFGSRCQYTFNLNTTIESFGDFVVSTFGNRGIFVKQIIIHTCYPYLSECYRGPAPMCLDWREICDGKIDCVGDHFGIDEEYCQELEMNECKEDEYRCHNGAQCIPLEFFRDGWASKDCLDGTDEERYFTLFGTDVIRRSPGCINLTTFFCEEITCRYPRSFSCGDGYCSQYLQTYYSGDLGTSSCTGTGRDFLHNQAIYMTINQLPSDCYELLFCKLKFYDIFSHDTYNRRYCLYDNWISSNNCSDEYLPFPAEPLLHGYFQLIYSSKRLLNDFIYSVQPDYVCNDPRLCLHLPKPTHQIGSLDCRPLTESLEDNIEEAPLFFSEVDQSARMCSSMGNINEFKSDSSLFYCERSHKYISKHRLIDGIIDCYYEEDEDYTDSCLLNDTQRYPCKSEKKCLSPLGIGFDLPDCKHQEDTLMNKYRQSVFSRLCDQVTDFLGDANETDESNCDLWPCYNPYTRCDGVFQCANGLDELGCPNTNCSVNEFKCYNEYYTNYQCIPYEKIYEKPINCSSNVVGIKLRTLFYASDLTKNFNGYIPWKNKTCLTMYDVCEDRSTDNQHLVCSMINRTVAYISVGSLLDMYDNKEVCRLTRGYFRLRDPLPFSTWNLGYLPSTLNEISLSSQKHIDVKKTTTKTVSMNNSIELIEYCNRGIVIFEGKSYEKKCLCPPSYFGSQCQWQTQRISLTLQIQKLTSVEKNHSVYDIYIYLIDDEYQIIHSYERINYIPSIDCQTKFNRYLLYPTRPKNNNTNYSIHIDIYDKITLHYYASWHLLISFPFLPVNRISTRLFIPSETTELSTNCSLKCGIHGKCFYYINSSKSFCHCDEEYSGRFCHLKHNCSCSRGSLCLNSSICLCPLDRFGSKCYLQYTSCQPSNPCKNNGQCIPMNDRINSNGFICLCPEDHMGPNCEDKSNKVEITFKTDIVPSVIFAHFITAFNDRKHERTTTFKKVPFNQNSITLFIEQTFHLLFTEFLNNTYLTVISEQFILSEQISTDVKIDNMCLNVTKFLNSTILHSIELHRLKYYHLPCIENLDLKCFYDEEHMCICDNNRFSNCFEFQHNMTYNCQGHNQCKNNARCFQDNATCPKISICQCEKCQYGSRCELTTEGYSLSLDVIFGYHITPSISFSRQSTAVKITTAVTILMVLFGFVSGSLSILTFRRKTLTEVGCGIYLLINSIISLLTISMFTIKYWQLILFQTNVITNRSFVNFNCVLTDVLLKILLSSGDWLNACVAAERAFTTIKGTRFNKSRSKMTAKYVIPILVLIIIISYLHDPLSRHLFDDKDEERTWCIVTYSSELKNYDRFINLFHFSTPFIINILSALIIITQVSRTRSKTNTKLTRRTLLCTEIKRHKHLIISPCILVILAFPRLVISFLTGCMQSARDPWTFLIGYYISFVPPLLIFIVFVLPSEKYKDEFTAAIRKKRLIFC